MADEYWRLPYTANQLDGAATNQVPRINSTNKHWEVWDIDTSAWVDTGVVAQGGGVASFNGRQGAILPESGDYSAFFAPAGYGLGIKANTLTAISDTEAIDSTGWYLAINGTTSHLPLAVAGIIRAEAYNANNVALTLYYNDGANSAICLRRKISGTWGAWEWLNPPLVAGTEYRTTERYNGNPVYVYRTQSKTLPTSGSTPYALPANINAVIEVFGASETGQPLANYPGITGISFNSTTAQIFVTTSGMESAMDARFCIKYTKSTN